MYPCPPPTTTTTVPTTTTTVPTTTTTVPTTTTTVPTTTTTVPTTTTTVPTTTTTVPTTTTTSGGSDPRRRSGARPPPRPPGRGSCTSPDRAVTEAWSYRAPLGRAPSQGGPGGSRAPEHCVGAHPWYHRYLLECHRAPPWCPTRTDARPEVVAVVRVPEGPMSPGLLAAYGSGRPEVPSAHAVPKVTSRPRQVVGTPSGRRRAGPPECAGAPDVWGKLGSGGAGCGAYLPELRGDRAGVVSYVATVRAPPPVPAGRAVAPSAWGPVQRRGPLLHRKSLWEILLSI